MKTTQSNIKRSEVSLNRAQSGVSLVEVLSTIAVLSFIVSLGYLGFTGTRHGSSEAALVTHTKQLNTAVAIYRANGGVVSQADTIDSILLKLKTAAAGESRTAVAGLRGSMIDARLCPLAQTATEAKSDESRVVWNGERKRFEIQKGGNPGAKAFIFDDKAIPTSEEMERYGNREVQLELAENSGWIWNYSTASSSSSGGPARLSQSTLSDLSPWMSFEGGSALAGGAGLIPTLEAPLFSLDGGEYYYDDFNLEITLSNPNDESTSSVIYAVNGGDWTEYDSGQVILVAPYDTIQAMTVSDQPGRFNNSLPKEELYESGFVLANWNNGVGDGEDGQPKGSPTINDGDGTSTGDPGNEGGAVNNPFFQADLYDFGGYTDPSWILYNGAESMNVNIGERFEIADIMFYNGRYVSIADSKTVNLSIDLTFGDSVSQTFGFTIDHVNTDNSGNEWTSADKIVAAMGQSLAGSDYMLHFEFKNSTDSGYADMNNFHVFESRSGTAKLFGTVVSLQDL